MSDASAADPFECDFELPVYRSLSGMGVGVDQASGAADFEELEAAAPAVAGTPTSEAEWMRSMPPLVKRQRAFNHLNHF